MWERIKHFLNSLQHETNIEDCADRIIEELQDSGLSEQDQYEIETSIYGLMDSSTTVKAFLRKAGGMIRKKVQEHEIDMMHEGLSYFDEEDEGEDEDEWDF